MVEGKLTILTPEKVIQMQNQMGIWSQPEGDWFGPLLPPPPAAPPSVKGRQWDYPAGSNLAYMPRGDQAISHLELRQLALNCDLVRMAIETCIDELSVLNIEIKPKDGISGADRQMQEATRLLKRPDKIHTWKQWMRPLVADMLVGDCATVYLRPTKGGQARQERGEPLQFGELFALEIIDGATIRPVIDAGGRTPLPPDPAYVQVLKGVVTADYRWNELIYFPRNPQSWRIYGLSPVEQIILTVNIMLRRDLHMLQYYTDGNLPDALLEVPEGWSTTQIAEWQQYWDARFAGNTAMRRRGTWVPKGMVPHVMKEMDLKNPLEEWFARKVMYNFSLSPQPFVQTINRATAETAQDTAQKQGIGPRMGWLLDLINLALELGGFDQVEASWKEETSLDPTEQAKIDDVNIKNGSMSVDEVREQRGLKPIGMSHAVYTASGPVLIKNLLNPPETAPPANPETTPEPGKEVPPATEKLAKATTGKKKVKIEPIDRQRPAIAKARSALQKLFQQAFKADMESAAEQLAKGLKLAKAADDSQIDKLLADLRLAGIEATREEVAAILARAAQNGGLAAFVQIDFEDKAITSQVNKLAVEWAENRAAELVTKIEESTRDYLRADVAQAVEEGWSTKQLSQALQENFGFSEARSDMIARTEIATADCEGNLLAYKTSGVVSGKEWLLGSEHDQDDECNENADEDVIPLDQAFASGDMAPPAHPNCVCDFLPVLGEEE